MHLVLHLICLPGRTEFRPETVWDLEMLITRLWSWYLYAPSIETNDLIFEKNFLSFRIAGLLPISSERHPAVSAAAGARMICDRVFARECWDGSP